MRRRILFLATVILAVAALTIFLSNGRQAGNAAVPSSLSLPPAAVESMDELLTALDEQLAARNPIIYTSLRPGISPEDLAQAEAQLAHAIHPDLAALYRWHNGLEDDRELFPGHGFFSLEEAVQLNREIRQSPLNFLLASEKTWLVLFPDAAGDGYYYDPGRTYEIGGIFYVFREDGYYRFFPSLRNLLKAIIEFYEEGFLPYELQPEDIDYAAQIRREEEILNRYGWEPYR